MRGSAATLSIRFCAPARRRKTPVLGARVCREALFRFYALPVIARQRRCRGNPIECRDLTTLPTDSHAHFRSLGMTSPTHARRQFRGDGLPGRALSDSRPPRHCEAAQVPWQSDWMPRPHNASIGFPRSLRSLGMTSPTRVRRTCLRDRSVFDYRGADFVITQFIPDGTYRSISRSGRTRQGERCP